MEDNSDDEEVEECAGDDAVLLVGVKLGGVAMGDNDFDELARARQQATPRKLFSSQPRPSQVGDELCLTQPSPTCPPIENGKEADQHSG
jgi:hypothetical protein